MSTKLRSDAEAIQQQRLNKISEGIKSNFKQIFELEKEKNPTCYVNKQFSNDIFGRSLMWKNDTTVFIDEINKLKY